MKKKSNKPCRHIVSALLTVVMAMTLFAGIPAGDMRQANAATVLQNPSRDSDGVVTWDCVYFGHYAPSESYDQTKHPIKWRVLSVDGNDAFLMADTTLDAVEYDYLTHTSVTWETCTMRSWLNGYGSKSNTACRDYSQYNFIDRAFTASEQNAIRSVVLENADNPLFHTEGGVNTQDKIFLLSYDEVTNQDYGFSSSYEKTDSARERRRGPNVPRATQDNSGFGSQWWLRSPGDQPHSVSYIMSGGKIETRGYDCANNFVQVCPALHLNLSSSNRWSYAGTVSSDGSSTEGDEPPSAEEEEPPSEEEEEPSSPEDESSDHKENADSTETEKTEIQNKVSIKTIKLSGISKKIAAGKKISLSADIRPTDATNKALTWTSSNPKYAVVSPSGVVKTKKAGAGKTVTVTAKAADGSEVQARYKIKIVKHAVKRISLKATRKSVTAGKKLKLKAAVKTTGKTANKTLIWTSSNPKYASVNKKGRVTTKKAGKGKTVTITAKATDGTGKKAKIKIKIK